jgi:hypothetical protein
MLSQMIFIQMRTAKEKNPSVVQHSTRYSLKTSKKLFIYSDINRMKPLRSGVPPVATAPSSRSPMPPLLPSSRMHHTDQYQEFGGKLKTKVMTEQTLGMTLQNVENVLTKLQKWLKKSQEL